MKEYDIGIRKHEDDSGHAPKALVDQKTDRPPMIL